MIFVPSDRDFFDMSYSLSYVNTSLIMFSALVLVATNGVVYGIAKKQYKCIRASQIPTKSSEICHEKRVLKSTYVCVCLVLSFVVSWLPVCVSNILVRSGLVETFPSVMELLPHLNSICYPLFFILFQKDVKKEMRKVLARQKQTWSNLM